MLDTTSDPVNCGLEFPSLTTEGARTVATITTSPSNTTTEGLT
jgi:hypothetical protein